MIATQNGQDRHPLNVIQVEQERSKHHNSVDFEAFGSPLHDSNIEYNMEASALHKIHLSEDTYSFMLTTSILSAPFLFAIAIFAFQLFVIFLVIPNNIDVQSFNPLNVPAGINEEVRISQFLSCIIVVLSLGDILKIPNMSMKDFYSSIPGLRPHVFWITTSLRLFEAAGVLITCFCLIASSSTVIDIFMNFAAMIFIADIDEIAFKICNIGFCGRSLKKATVAIEELEITGRKHRKRTFVGLASRFISIFILIGFISGLGFVSYQQSKGHFLCKTVMVQFADEINNSLGYMSGVYEQDATKIAGKVSFVETRPNGKGRFAYCQEENSWTFSVDTEVGPNPCSWLAKSPDTIEFDITNSDVKEWSVLNQLNQPLPFVSFVMYCVDCNRFVSDKACSSNGVCVDNHCSCDPGRYGLSCEFSEPCEIIESDVRRERFFSYSARYHQLENMRSKVQSYERPVYISEAENDVDVFDIIMFVGRRWVTTKSNQLRDFNPRSIQNKTVKENLADYFDTEFHGDFSHYSIDYISEETDILTPEAGVTPVDLEWFHAKSDKTPDYGLIAPVVLLCAICTPDLNNNRVYDLSCFGNGVCDNGVCICKTGFFGSLCQAEICRVLNVAFDNKITPEFAGITGTYMLDTLQLNKMPVYFDRRSKRAVLAYCDSATENYWSMILLGPRSKIEVSDTEISFIQKNICSSWQVRSSVLGTYDITTVEDSQWVTRDIDSNEPAPMGSFSISCLDCDKATPSNLNYGVCRGGGTCGDEGKCFCKSDRWGTSCEFSYPLSQVSVDESLGGIPNYSETVFHSLRGSDGNLVRVYNHPVYMQKESQTSLYEIMVFVGTRWILTKSDRIGLPQSKASQTELSELDLAEYFENSFHGKWSEYSADFITEQTNKRTRVYDPTPKNLDWYAVSGESSNWNEADQAISISIEPSTCNKDKRCNHDGTCVKEKCKCNVGYYGNYCEKKICTKINVLFGREVSASLEYFSGEYTITNYTISDRSVYQDTNLGNAWIAYCKKDKFWSFTYQNPVSGPNYNVDPCVEWKARSSITHLFEVTSLDEWLITSDQTGNAVTDVDFGITCIDCDHDSAQTNGKICNERGACNGHVCECEEEWYGPTCEFSYPCKNLEIDPRYSPFPASYAKEYEILEDERQEIVKVYDFPVYFKIWENEKVDLIINIGRRWILTHDKLISKLKIEWNRDIRAQLSSSLRGFHGFWDKFEFVFITESTLTATAASPVWMVWYDTWDLEKSRSTLLLCTECNTISNACRNGGVCVAGSCDCTGTGFLGQLCQLNSDLCPTFDVRGLGGFSGLYSLNDSILSGEQRPIYTSRRGDGAQFGYCYQNDQWGFTGFNSLRNLTVVPQDPCNTMMYAASDAFDLSNVMINEWETSPTYDGPALTNFEISCTSCGQADGIGDDRVCGNSGICIDGQCMCDSDHFGNECENERPCPNLESESLEGFPGDWPDRWDILTTNDSKMAMVYDHPVYISEAESKIFFILYNGNQWVMSHTEWLFDIDKSRPTKDDLEEYLSHSFHSYLSHYKFGLHVDIGDTFVPIGLPWKENDKAIGSKLICAVCDEHKNKCENMGSCNSVTGRCECLDGFSGARCQHLHSSCFLQPGIGIPFCKCHVSCASCGYLQYPVAKNNCIKCADGSWPQVDLNTDGTGTCLARFKGHQISELKCFEAPHIGKYQGDEYKIGRVSLGVCECHQSCRTCYKPPDSPMKYAPSTACISCKDGYGIRKVREENGITMGICSDAARLN